MKTFQSADIRNIVVAGHSGAGKTTLSEAMLFAAGATTRQGKVSDGTSVLDFTPDEIKRKTGVYLGLAQFEFLGKKVNLLDCPGYADYVGEVYAGVKAADFGVLVVSAVSGVESDTERHYELMSERDMPRFIAVNQMDKEQADFPRVQAQIAERLADRAAPLYLPIGQGANFKGVVDVMAEKAYAFNGKDVTETAVPGDMSGAVKEAHSKIMELAAESDDALLEKFLETLELTPEETKKGLHAGIIKGRIYPLLPVCADKSMGAGLLLKMLIELGPSPLEVPGMTATKVGSGQEVQLTCKPDGVRAAILFKVTSEVMAQEIAFLRCYSGTFEHGGDVFDTSNDHADRVGHFYNFLGKERTDAEHLVAGDIAAVAKLKTAHLNHTLSQKDGVIVTPIAFPRPVHEVAIAAKVKNDEDKVGTALHKLKEEDATFEIGFQSDLHQTVLHANGDQHVDLIIDRIRRKFHVEVDVTKPKVPFRETVRGLADTSYRHKKQSGGRGQFADVSMKIEPMPRGGGFEFLNEIVGGAIPSRFIPAVEKGVRESMDVGPLCGYPVVDFRVRLHFGGYHDVDSSEMAFKIAGSMAMKEGLEKAGLVLLEPVMLVTVTVPDDYMGDVMGDLSSRRGKIQGMEPDGRVQRIKAAVPQVELYRYSTTLRSLTQGRARYRADFSHYEEVPRDAAEKLIEQLRKERKEVEA